MKKEDLLSDEFLKQFNIGKCQGVSNKINGKFSKINSRFFMPIFIIAALGIFTWSSCDKQTCENVVCSGNNTVCQNGQCVCANGFEGPNCDTYSFEKFIGNYQVSENCQNTLQGNTNNFYNMYITIGGNINTVVINNFLGFATVEATIIGNEIFISSQNLKAVFDLAFDNLSKVFTLSLWF